MRPILTPLTLVLIAAAPPPNHKKVMGNAALKPLQGTWVRTVYAYQLVGDSPDMVAEKGDIEVAIAGDQLTYTYVPESLVAASFTITKCSRKGTKHLDLMEIRGPDCGRAVQALYSVSGDTLKLATPLTPDGLRPASLNSVGSGERHEMFTRKKP